MWQSCTWPQIKSTLLIRSNTLHTAASHSTRPYTTANGSSFADTCPLCAHCSPNLPPRDTPGHCLGSCCHPQLKSSYIARHNRSLCLIQKTLSACSPTAWYTIMDASSSTRLPPGVASTRLPTWLLPSLPTSSLDKLRPDMLIFHGLSLARFSSLSTLLSNHDPTTIADLKTSCILHVVELTHTADAAYNDTILLL